MCKRNVLGKKSMSRKETILALVALSAMTVGLQAKAGGDGPGNGGNAVVVDGKLYLLDLVEAGVQKMPFLGDGKVDSGFIRDAQYAFHNAARLDNDVGKALTERLANLEPLVREQFLAAFSLYSWRIVDLPVEEIKGVKSPIDLKKTKVYQAAYRRDRSILISRAIWDQLDVGNKAALIVHEIVYAMLTPKSDGAGKLVQESWDAREIVGEIFTESSRYSTIRNFTRDGKPMLSIFAGFKTPATGTVSDIMSFGVNGLERNYSVSFGAHILVRGATESRKDAIWFGANAKTYDELRNGTSMIDKYWNIPETCAEAMNYRKGRMVVEQGYTVSRMTLKDYETADGPTKYVAAEYFDVYGQGMGYSNPRDGKAVEFPGSIELKFSSKADCESRIRPALVRIAATVMMRYDSSSLEKYLDTL